VIRVLALLLATTAIAQDIDVGITYQSYAVGGSDLAEVMDQMEAEGPNGYPAYAEWYVRWTADCELSMTATITLPALGPDADLSAEEEATFRAMLQALERHETGHIGFGIGFARDVQEMRCKGDTDGLLQAWLAAERAYDQETEHGCTQGACLVEN
jgi:predicted secreted Zn-dependent protease